MADVCVDLCAFESLLKVLVDGLVGDFAQKCQVGNANLLLLGRLEGGLLGLRAAAARSSTLSIAGGLVLGTSGYTLRMTSAFISD